MPYAVTEHQSTTACGIGRSSGTRCSDERHTTVARIDVGRHARAGHGLCYGAAPVILDCDDQGDPVATLSLLTGDNLAAT
ncbi:hypothetical protein GTZ89_34380 [Streptomyces sp. SID8382]|nr:hypothetical protein [Streptomyces sp. SID8382]QDL68398.1 hypothetical protein DNK48_02300 [Streptomyces malaysiensis]